jgi:peptide/nickel transport system substrate-binding protein
VPMHRRTFLKTTTALGASAPFVAKGAQAQGRADSLLIVAEGGPNALDIHVPGANRPVFGLAWNTYDRLITFGATKTPTGEPIFDYHTLKPELASEWQEASDGMSVTFKLRKDATFHDGKPVTAKDVKWSFDRALSVGGFPTNQMNAGSMEKKEQFVAVDDHTFRVDFLRKDKLTMPDLAVLCGVVVNSELVKANAKPEDPWGVQWTRTNAAGGGAFKIESFKPGQETIYVRNDSWKCGPLPKLRRVIFREVPSAANRRALLERGDADLSFDLPPRDLSEIVQAGKLKVVGVPMSNTVLFIGMSSKVPPFDNVKVRQAVAHAIPYEKIKNAAVYGRARMLNGGAAEVTSTKWPEPLNYDTNLAKAKALLAEAGFPNGFETQFSFEASAATLSEPIAVLLQESLAQIGVKVTINKVPAGQLRGHLVKKELPLFTDTFGAWFDDPDYYFFLFYHGSNGPWNSTAYVNPEMTRLIDQARVERDSAKYKELIMQMIRLARTDVPAMPLFQPYLDVAMQKNVEGYLYMFHRQMEFRTLYKT